METKICSVCGAKARYDGRCGDDPYLACDCSKEQIWIDDGRGGYHVNLNGARPISVTEFLEKKLR